ncbi:hypothetical protein [Candidatus Vampirococcus lugosii]|uniref:ABC-type oligopeptide transport system, periplasmic component n=1 Tax=Candidatus Vampirococcus lugosii TaxID=2789015 RepID=A0ABS5QL29_9BACT|nr:hypothetical protein [Candidatus Vampirococcus lugosii]MBS8121918.1 ABC-type oligopeptide transport system, periplasmic component [Candidatus Vampirococcus lugosii]
MKITHWKFFKYFYSGILVLWILITVHVVYAFVYDISEQVPVKGGTFVHGVFSQATYLPYLSNTGEDKFFQSLLFNGCLSPYVDNTNIEFEEDLCNIKTSNFRVFEISVKEGKKWNDGTPITNDDIFFTYNELIKNNIRNISSLNSFSNLEIQDQGDFIKIIFPNGSKDNEIFLSNFILPRHLLKGKDVTYYVENYSNNPIGSNCATFRQSTSDKDSIIFDMNNCDESFVMNYQVKNFDSFEDFQKYQKNSDLIDLYIGNDLLNGFRNNKVILNNFVSIFFNVEADNVSSNIRRTISQIIYNNIYKGDYKKYFIKDKFLFDTDIQGGAPRTVFEELEKEITSPKEVEVELENMPNELNLENLTGTFYLDSIDDLFNISFDLGQNFDSVSVQHNDGQAYVLQGYDQSSIARYNISERFQI